MFTKNNRPFQIKLHEVSRSEPKVPNSGLSPTKYEFVTQCTKILGDKLSRQWDFLIYEISRSLFEKVFTQEQTRLLMKTGICADEGKTQDRTGFKDSQNKE